MKVKIRKWNAVATWRWDIPEDDVCGICQVHFDGTCPTCKYPGDECTLRTSVLCPSPVSARPLPTCYSNSSRTYIAYINSLRQMRPQLSYGKRHRAEHMSCMAGRACSTDKQQHCIVEWIKQDSSKGQCPMCRQSRHHFQKHLCPRPDTDNGTEFEWTEISNKDTKVAGGPEDPISLTSPISP